MQAIAVAVVDELALIAEVVSVQFWGFGARQVCQQVDVVVKGKRCIASIGRLDPEPRVDTDRLVKMAPTLLRREMSRLTLTIVKFVAFAPESGSSSV